MELVTIARPYAEALFRVARTFCSEMSAGVAVPPTVSGVTSPARCAPREADRTADKTDLAAWSDWLAAFSELAAHPALLSLTNHPNIEREFIYKFIVSIIRPLNRQAENFMRLIINNRRLNALPEIVRQFNALKNADQHIVEVNITTAFKLDKRLLNSLLKKFAQWFNQPVKQPKPLEITLNPKVNIDPSLIGGVILTVGDQVLDASIRGQLIRMSAQLAR